MFFSSDHLPNFCIWGMLLYLQGVGFSLEDEGFCGGFFFFSFLRKLVLWHLHKLSNGRDWRKCKYL